MTDKFTDAQGREWLLSLTYGDVKRVRKLIGVNLFTLIDKSVKVSKEELESGDASPDQLPIFMQLQIDPIMLGDVIYALVKPQLDERNVSEDSFSSAIGPREFKAAKEIFWRLYQNFFLEAGEPIQAKMIAGALRLSEGLEAGVSNLEGKIDQTIEDIAKM